MGGKTANMTVTGRTRVPLPLGSMRFCAARTARGQGRGSAVQTGFQGLHRSPQLLHIGKAGVQLFPGGGAVHVGGEIQRLQLCGGAPDGPAKGIHRPQRIGGRGGLGRRRGQLGGHHPAVSADDAPCVLAVGRDHDVLPKAVLLHFPQNVAKIILS